MKFGTDPEIFIAVKDSQTKYDEFVRDEFVIIPPVLFESGDLKILEEHAKHPIIFRNDIGKVIMDGSATELNFFHPFDTPGEMFDGVHHLLNDFEAFVGEAGLEVSKHPVINFDYRKYWKEGLDPESLMFQAMIFGCDRDEDAFNSDWVCDTIDARTHPYRYGGGHIHLSNSPVISKYPKIAIEMLALTIGNFCIVNSPYPDLDKIRSKYYGKPGKFRYQNYPDGSNGVEYRTPSNSWLSYEKKTFLEMMEWIDVALFLVENKELGEEVLDNMYMPTLMAITEVNKEISNQVLDEIKGVI